MNAELAYDARASLGEAALWHEGRLLWVDIDAGTVNRFDPSQGTNESWSLGQMVGTVVPRACGGFVVGAQRGVGVFDPLTAQFKIVADLSGGRTDMRSNDGKCDPRGRLFVGTIGLQKPRPPGALYRVDPEFRVTCVVEGTGTANGLAWSLDHRTMYFIDTPTRAVSAFDYDGCSGQISGRREVVRFGDEEPGRPDGMTIDSAGRLWIALYEGGAVVCCDPQTGAILERIAVPAARTTSCAFGGADLGDLYITSGRDPAAPQSGGLFVARPGVLGVSSFAFGG